MRRYFRDLVTLRWVSLNVIGTGTRRTSEAMVHYKIQQMTLEKINFVKIPVVDMLGFIRSSINRSTTIDYKKTSINSIQFSYKKGR